MNLLKTIGSGALQVLKTVAPTIAATAAGPFAPLVDPIMQKIFGTTEPAKLDAALTNATPEQLLALKQAENEHTENLAKLGIQRDQLAFDDTANARAMQMTTKDPTAGRLAWLMVGGFLGLAIGECLAMVVWPQKWAAIPAGAVGIMGTLMGYLASEAKQVAAFYFGSSADSQAKTQTLSEIAKS